MNWDALTGGMLVLATTTVTAGVNYIIKRRETNENNRFLIYQTVFNKKLEVFQSVVGQYNLLLGSLYHYKVLLDRIKNFDYFNNMDKFGEMVNDNLAVHMQKTADAASGSFYSLANSIPLFLDYTDEENKQLFEHTTTLHNSFAKMGVMMDAVYDSDGVVQDVAKTNYSKYIEGIIENLDFIVKLMKGKVAQMRVEVKNIEAIIEFKKK
jgi:hypothetical protein